MSLSREDIAARQAEHDALCLRQPGERDWKGNLVSPEPETFVDRGGNVRPIDPPEPEPEPEPVSDFESDFNT